MLLLLLLFKMSYDIPPPLEHKEKIMFGLTFNQLAYAFPAFLMIFFLIFRMNLPITVSGTISLIVAFSASFFMFFDGLNKIRHWYNYFKNPQVKVLSKLLKQIVDIKKIKDNIVHQSKVQLAIIEVIPMNFMLKTEEEKESIIIGFQKFLNSLDFPIQIHISSNPIKLGEHFSYTDKKAKEKEDMKELVDSYCGFVRKSIEDNNIQNRNFYVIIKEKDNLDMQVKVCSEGLKSLGLKVK